MKATLEFAVSALVIWCQHLLKTHQLDVRQQAQLEKLIKDIERFSSNAQTR